MIKSWICSSCGSRMGTKQPDNATWHAGRCSYCSEKSYVTEPRDFGISTTSGQEVGDQGVEDLKNLFNMK